MSRPVLEQLERLELELNVFRDHHTLEDLVVIGGPDLENDQNIEGFPNMLIDSPLMIMPARRGTGETGF